MNSSSIFFTVKAPKDLMFFALSPKESDFKLQQPEKASSLIPLMLSGKQIVCNLKQLKKALAPMCVNSQESFTDSMPSHSSNKDLLILFIPVELKSTISSPLHPLNAPSPKSDSFLLKMIFLNE